MLSFSPLLYNILSLFLISVSLITLRLGVFLLRFNLPRTLCTSWIGSLFLFPYIGKFSMKTIFSNIFLDPFSLSSSETPIMRMLVHLMLSQRTLRLTSVFFFFFPILCFIAVISTFCLPGHLSVPLPRLFFYWFLLVYCSSLFCLFSSARSFVNISYICFIFFPRFWIIYTIIMLNCFPGPSSTSFSYFSGVLSYSFIWEIILCLFISVNFCGCGFHSGGFGIVVLPASSFCPQVNEADARDWWWEKLGLILVGWVKL